MVSLIDFEQARINMIEQQIRPWEVLDPRVLALLHEIHREDFVDDSYRELALADLNIPLAHDQVMMTPKIEARLIQALDIRKTDTALEIGTGSGYLTALLASSAKSVESIDIYTDFIELAESRLKKYALDNVTLSTADFLKDWKSTSRYDVIAITGSLPELDPEVQNLLNTGGRLFVVTGNPPVMEALLITRIGDEQWSREVLLETELPPLIGASRPSTFQL